MEEKQKIAPTISRIARFLGLRRDHMVQDPFGGVWHIIAPAIWACRRGVQSQAVQGRGWGFALCPWAGKGAR
jgi:hypothetical protein